MISGNSIKSLPIIQYINIPIYETWHKITVLSKMPAYWTISLNLNIVLKQNLHKDKEVIS